MSLIKPIDLTGIQGIKEAIQAVISGRVDRIQWSETVNLRIVRDNAGSAELIITDGKVEVSLKGLPDPDLISAKCFIDHAIVSLSLTNVRVNY
jgi:hypothetical protein